MNKENCIISVDDVRAFLTDNGGKVKQSDLVNHFRDQLSNPATKARARQEFKDILQLVTAVKVENNVKFIVLINDAGSSSSHNLQANVLLRKAARPLSIRKDMARSKGSSMDEDESHTERPSPRSPRMSPRSLTPRESPYTSQQGLQSAGQPPITTIPPTQTSETKPPTQLGSQSTLSSISSSVASDATASNCSTIDSGIGSIGSNQGVESKSVGTLRNQLKAKLEANQSLESVHTDNGDYDDDIEEDVGLNDALYLGPNEKEWMIAASQGNMDTLRRLYKTDPTLIKFKEFVHGYTVLHWAAKLGKPDVLKFAIHAGMDVHCKTNGGYSPLHLAAMAGKDEIILELIETYKSSIHVRDYSGKKPKDIVKETVDAAVQRKLGRSLVLEPEWMKMDAELERRGSINPCMLTSSAAGGVSGGDRKHSFMLGMGTIRENGGNKANSKERKQSKLKTTSES